MMKIICSTTCFLLSILFSSSLFAQADGSKHLFMDVHQLTPGKISYEDVAKAHAKDLATQKKYGVEFLKFWVDEKKGLVYCLSSSPDTLSIHKTHAEAHGLLPGRIY